MDRILTCLDTSPRAAIVLEKALELATLTGAKLTLFRSVGVPPDLHHDVIGIRPEDISARLLAAARADLERRAEKIPPAHLDGVHVQLGIAWDAICAAAREFNSDLVVIGSHGYGGLDLLLGTTASKVVNHIDRPVLVVR